MNELTYEMLRDAVAGRFVAARSRLTLEPAGGPGDKVFPPTYGVADGATTKYATETRIIDGTSVPTVLLDSVASQANRHELALLDGWELGELHFPNAFVDFTVDDDLVDLGHLSALEAPHRIADAIFRDSLLDGTLFRMSAVGRAVTEARPAAATGLYRYSPAALVFGMWDSTGPRGGLGSKFERSFVSEIVGFDAVQGSKVSSRIDPLGIEKSAATVYEHQDPDQVWTIDELDAAKDGGKPRPYGKSGEKGRPSLIVHGNVTPSIDPKAGGVTISSAVQLTVLSFAGLRKLRFPIGTDDAPIARERRREAETAARAALAALGLAAIVYQREMDFALRSRCLLVPTEPGTLELLPRDGSAPTRVELGRDSAAALLTAASDAAAELGLAWADDEIRLRPAPKLIELVKRSRAVAADVTPE